MFCFIALTEKLKRTEILAISTTLIRGIGDQPKEIVISRDLVLSPLPECRASRLGVQDYKQAGHDTQFCFLSHRLKNSQKLMKDK
ncbi:hypothetical protein PoB_005159700 [Plakobranchus ocellatus]|uniref:Uncharacterized protein n=1 Tax=Plakobranchus ocellatus TaxID=259542 RepID=A0AAV4C0H8_9GAST|nr:hypothetical protein PoB_005159700 [Plakobranchus ocellatus]